MIARDSCPPDGVRAQSDRLVELQLDDPAWLDFVAAATEATVFHLPAWNRVLADTYRYRAVALATVNEQGRVTAGAPLARVRRLSGAAWVSFPFSDHCPPLALDRASLDRLAAALAAWTAGQGVRVEVRGALPATPGCQNVVVGVRHVLALDRGVDALRKRLSDTHRRRLRQAEQGGLQVRFGQTAEEMDAFYRLHVLTRHRQGVPVQPRRFFRAIWRRMIASGHGVVVLVETPAGRALAGAVVLACKETAIVKFQASDESGWELRPNHLCYWAAIRRASETGHRYFDFGRTETRHAGLQQFKAGWGAEPIPLTYATMGGGGLDVDGPGLLDAAMRQVIRRSPAVVCRTLGSLLYRYAA